MPSRIIDRIPVFLNLIDWDSYVDNILPVNDKNDVKRLKESLNHENTKREIKIFWIKHPDLRISQVLVNLGFIPNYIGFWYYLEESEVLLKLKVPVREFMFWGVNYTKDMIKIPETKWVLIKDLRTEHIKAILDGGFVSEINKYHRYFTDELKLREDVNSNPREEGSR